MSILSFAFCKDAQGNFGLVRAFDHGFLTVVFDYGTVRVSPKDLTFI